MKFPFDKLKPAGGEAYCHLFENVRTGTPRALYWSFRVSFTPVRYGNSMFETAATCEWITWPTRSWRKLAGNSLSKSSRLVEPETSFYLEEHYVADRAELQIDAVVDTMVSLRLSLTANIEGLHGEIYPNTTISAHAKIPFVGIYVLPDNLFPKPGTAEEATTLLAQYFDISELETPEWERFRFTFRPRAA
jgi:hypothetical protein